MFKLASIHQPYENRGFVDPVSTVTHGDIPWCGWPSIQEDDAGIRGWGVEGHQTTKSTQKAWLKGRREEFPPSAVGHQTSLLISKKASCHVPSSGLWWLSRLPGGLGNWLQTWSSANFAFYSRCVTWIKSQANPFWKSKETLTHRLKHGDPSYNQRQFSWSTSKTIQTAVSGGNNEKSLCSSWVPGPASIAKCQPPALAVITTET